MSQYLLAIDQGTTSTRAILFNEAGQPTAQFQKEITQYFPKDGWVEHDPEEIWQSVLACGRGVIQQHHISPQQIMAIGISNQRETTIIWDRKTGNPIYKAIVWQDRRTAAHCEMLGSQPGVSEMVQQKTGLLIDPYFSGSKIQWLLQEIPDALQKARDGELAFGTIDCFLLWKLTQGKVHATDATNASRTLLYNIQNGSWDEKLLSLFDVPRALLPHVLDNAAEFGVADPSHFGAPIPITGMAGDQQAATVGQACFHPGMVKSTYGTGCFVLLNTGEKIIYSQNRLISTIAYQLNHKAIYGLEGSIFVAGAAVQWLRDAVKMIHDARETQQLALETEDTGGVYLVPAFTGLGAPYWDPEARGALLGLTRNSGVKQIVRAALEAVCYQTQDLCNAMRQDGATFEKIRVDGGMTANNWLLQFLADILNMEVQRPTCIETSARGAAFLAGLGIGYYKSLDEIESLWQPDCSFHPSMATTQRETLYQGWIEAVKRITHRKK